MKKNLILIFFFSVIAFMYGKEKVKKHRDQIRLDGFNDIEVSIYTDNDGHSVKHVWCRNPGKMRCRDQNFILPETDFDNPAQYNPSELLAAQVVIDLGDNDIDNGSTSGTRTSTIQFVDVVTSLTYYRTFTYTWVSTTLGEVNSVLDISDKF